MITCKLSEIARSTKGKKPKSVSKEKTEGFEIPYVDIKAFEKGIVDNYTDGENCTFCKPDDVLIVWDGARCGFVGRGVEGAIGSTLAKISSDKYTNDFLFYFLQSKYKVLNSNPRGVGIPHIEPNLLWNFEIPDVDKTTQRAIVTRIETLFAELDKAVQHLRTAQQQLKTYRQAVLNHWLNNDDGKWEMVKLGDVIEKPTYGTSKKCDYDIEGTGVLRIPNIGNGCIIDDDLKFAVFSEEEKEKYDLKEGDLLTIRSNGSVDLVGKCALISSKEEKYLFAGYLIRLRPFPAKVNSKFLSLTLESHKLRIQIEDKAKSTSGVNNINSVEIQNLEIPLPPLTEQQRIVAEIESRLSQATASETYIENALQQAEALRQSILKKAFSGELE
ncbi:MAG: restriction endonuclease subunit S [Salinivirgaceae bacterium]|nr:restriction endonuclease subunit S [Salinivirgaceae bacterium]